VVRLLGWSAPALPQLGGGGHPFLSPEQGGREDGEHGGERADVLDSGAVQPGE
jgi:hypothetical protein